jgi:hypothetical protein
MLNIEVRYDPEIHFPPKKMENICPQKNLHMNVQDGIIHNGKKWKQPSI